MGRGRVEGMGEGGREGGWVGGRVGKGAGREGRREEGDGGSGTEGKTICFSVPFPFSVCLSVCLSLLSTDQCDKFGHRRAMGSSPFRRPVQRSTANHHYFAENLTLLIICSTSGQSSSLEQRQFSVQRHVPSVHDTTRPSVIRHSHPGQVSQLLPQVTSARQWPSSIFFVGAPLLLKVYTALSASDMVLMLRFLGKPTCDDSVNLPAQHN